MSTNNLTMGEFLAALRQKGTKVMVWIMLDPEDGEYVPLAKSAVLPSVQGVCDAGGFNEPSLARRGLSDPEVIYVN